MTVSFYYAKFGELATPTQLNIGIFIKNILDEFLHIN